MLDELNEREREAAGDAVCSLSSEAAGRSALVDAGAVRTMAALLNHVDSELRVRALLSLGMLVADPRAAQQLVSNGASMRRISQLAHSSPQDAARLEHDSDEAMIAADIVSSLMRHPDLGPAAAAAVS